MKWKVTIVLECNDCAEIDKALNLLREKELIIVKEVNVDAI